MVLIAAQKKMISCWYLNTMYLNIFFPRDWLIGIVEERWQWSERQLTLRSKRRPHYEWFRWTNHCWKPPEHSCNIDQGHRPFRSCKYKLPQKIISTIKLFSGKVRLNAFSKWVKEPHCYLTLLPPKVISKHFMLFLIQTRPVHKNLFLEFPKKPGSFMLRSKHVVQKKNFNKSLSQKVVIV